MNMFDRIRRAFRPVPVIPNVSADRYYADRNDVNVIKSMARIVQIGPFKFRCWADDWPTIAEAETAASKLAVILNTSGHIYKDMPVNEVLDQLGEAIRLQMGTEDERPFGMCFVAEPL